MKWILVEAVFNVYTTCATIVVVGVAVGDVGCTGIIIVGVAAADAGAVVKVGNREVVVVVVVVMLLVVRMREATASVGKPWMMKVRNVRYELADGGTVQSIQCHGGDIGRNLIGMLWVMIMLLLLLMSGISFRRLQDAIGLHLRRGRRFTLAPHHDDDIGQGRDVVLGQRERFYLGQSALLLDVRDDFSEGLCREKKETKENGISIQLSSGAQF